MWNLLTIKTNNSDRFILIQNLYITISFKRGSGRVRGEKVTSYRPKYILIITKLEMSAIILIIAITNL